MSNTHRRRRVGSAWHGRRKHRTINSKTQCKGHRIQRRRVQARLEEDADPELAFLDRIFLKADPHPEPNLFQLELL
jgi:hypothetical protein